MGNKSTGRNTKLSKDEVEKHLDKVVFVNNKNEVEKISYYEKHGEIA